MCLVHLQHLHNTIELKNVVSFDEVIPYKDGQLTKKLTHTI